MDKETLKQRIQEWATRMAVSTNEIHIRAMKSKWASVSTDGRLTMDSSILDLRGGLCDYIIVHELLHLKVRNHGKLFKSLMHAYLPGWEELERELGTVLKGREKL
jgi:predicted metal-dependent hydrolase